MLLYNDIFILYKYHALTISILNIYQYCTKIRAGISTSTLKIYKNCCVVK